jgi:CYTH domain-containing protein
MSRELERKFLARLPPAQWRGVEVMAGSAVEIDQGYLTPLEAAAEVRLRKGRELAMKSAGSPAPGSRVGPDGPKRPYILTVKVELGESDAVSLNRPEYEINLDEAEFDELWPLTKGRRLKKVRTSYAYRSPEVEAAGLCIDDFRGALEGLSLIEIEFDRPEAASSFVPFQYLGPEVTGDPRYRNSELASADRPPSPEPEGEHGR